MHDWASTRGTSLQELISVNFREGRTDVPKRSADIGFQTDTSLGVVIVWESGELETEAIDIQSEVRFAIRADVLDDPEDLLGVLDRFAQAMIAGLPDSGSNGTAQS